MPAKKKKKTKKVASRKKATNKKSSKVVKKKATKKVAKKKTPAKKTTKKTAKKIAKKVAKKATKKATKKVATSAAKKKTVTKKTTKKVAKKQVKAAAKPAPKPAPVAKKPKKTTKVALLVRKEADDKVDEVEYFTQDELAYFKELLLKNREDIMQKARSALESGNIQMDTNEMTDEVDLASVTIAQNLQFRLLDRDRKLLGEINHALDKIQQGDFGYCEGTGELIPKRRLELRPWTRHSVKYKEVIERMKKSGRGVGDEDTQA